MKKLITLTVLVLSLNSFAGEVVCGHTSEKAKRFYPVNKLALEIAQKFEVLTCNGDRFKEFVAAKKHTKKTVIITKEQVKKIRKALQKANATW